MCELFHCTIKKKEENKSIHLRTVCICHRVMDGAPLRREYRVRKNGLGQPCGTAVFKVVINRVNSRQPLVIWDHL